MRVEINLVRGGPEAVATVPPMTSWALGFTFRLSMEVFEVNVLPAVRYLLHSHASSEAVATVPPIL